MVFDQAWGQEGWIIGYASYIFGIYEVNKKEQLLCEKKKTVLWWDSVAR